VTTKASMRLAANLATQAEAVEIEVRAQAASIRSETFRERLAALQARITGRG
jgi:enoyl-CoA hydratase